MSASLSEHQHSKFEDFLALVTGTILVSLGIYFFKQAGLLTGGTAGVALLITHAAVELPFGLTFFVLNLPFYWLAYQRMGRAFTLKTIAAVTLVSLFSDLMPTVLTFATLQPIYGAISGGFLLGVGMLILFRHKASLGGFNVLALLLQDRFKVNAGQVQLGLDFCILATSFFIVPVPVILISILGAACLNVSIALNHKPGRYIGMS